MSGEESKETKPVEESADESLEALDKYFEENPFDGDDGEEDTDTETDSEEDGVTDEPEGEEDKPDQPDDSDPAPAPAEPESKPDDDGKASTVEAGRMEALLLDVAKANGFETVEEYLLFATNGNEEEVKAALSEVANKASVPTKKEAESEEVASPNENRGRAIHDRVLKEIHDAYPSTVETVKDLNADVDDPAKFMELLSKGVSPAEAYAAVNYKKLYAKAAKASQPSGKDHLSGAGFKASGGSSSIPKDVLREMRDSFPGMKDSEIADLYRRCKND